MLKHWREKTTEEYVVFSPSSFIIITQSIDDCRPSFFKLLRLPEGPRGRGPWGRGGAVGPGWGRWAVGPGWGRGVGPGPWAQGAHGPPMVLIYFLFVYCCIVLYISNHFVDILSWLLFGGLKNMYFLRAQFLTAPWALGEWSPTPVAMGRFPKMPRFGSIIDHLSWKLVQFEAYRFK